MDQNNSISLLMAFSAGVLSFISPCVLPIVPGYLSFISGVNVAQFKEGGAPRDLVRRVVLTSLAFVLVTLASALVFHEPVTGPKIAGIALICLGILVGSQG